jgi:Asp-tRNA(Asn)/Glu-tRNA(Gln) amidotransferase A subunit family amidase
MSAYLHALTRAQSRVRLADGTLTPSAYADGLLAHIGGTEATLQAWATLDPAHVHACAARLDLVHGTARGPLHGIPVGVKDIIATAELPTQMGSPVYAGHQPGADAECVARVARAGGYVMGKTITTELAFLHPGPTTNPWNAAHTPGGSSSGSAAAVAAGQVPAAIGTQTNGSVIRPAAFCGVVGFKPSVDAIPFAGTHVFSATLDTLGTFTRTVADAAWLASVLADPGRIAPAVGARERPPRLAYLADFPWTRVGCDADDTLDAVATRLRLVGAEVIAVVLPDALHEAARVLRTIMLHEAAGNLAPLQDRARGQLSPELNAALDEGRAIDAVAYAHARASRRAMMAAALDWTGHYDAILCPPATGPAPEGLATTGDPACCTLWSLLGFPAITLPVGRAGNGLPLGLQLAAPAGADDALLAVAAWCEAKIAFRGLVPAA